MLRVEKSYDTSNHTFGNWKLKPLNKGEVKLYSLVIVYTWAQENNTVCICSHSYMQKKKTKKKQKTQL